jgi:SAM-dependent methyltransferase
MHRAVGGWGNFDQVGDIEVKILKRYGLQDGMFLIDVGCGSGRLTQALERGPWAGKYVGVDVVRALLDYAARGVDSDRDVTFKLTDGLTLNFKDADLICFFSVLTHLKPEESYVYLAQARDALRAGGRIVASYLDYRGNWPIFETMVLQVAKRIQPVHLNTFLEANTLSTWTSHLGLRLVDLRPADDATFGLGQALIVMEK